ncbi:E3 ubiquitin-protein ligase SINAT5 [Acorus gramineus]|uniref:E3 ubiquitin-protein ligase SINAT5 n=1 Tax=Acorus gramineus TaxID=55184 RepID=A0AAV9BMW5_ACOGR|nr:E3 ubiquitin-protein ligase SINAT5 [Acorus gramineus]
MLVGSAVIVFSLEMSSVPSSAGLGVFEMGTSGVSAGISPTTSMHELLECPICTNSMYS